MRDVLHRQAARTRWRMIRAFVFGLIAGLRCLFAALWIVASRLPHYAAFVAQRLPSGFGEAAVAQAARDHGAAPGARRAVDLIEIVAGRLVVAAGAPEADGTPMHGDRGAAARRARCSEAS